MEKQIDAPYMLDYWDAEKQRIERSLTYAERQISKLAIKHSGQLEFDYEV